MKRNDEFVIRNAYEAERLVREADEKTLRLDKVSRGNAFEREDLTQEIASATARAQVHATLAGLSLPEQTSGEDAADLVLEQIEVNEK